MKRIIYFIGIALFTGLLTLSSCNEDDTCTETTWYEDADNDGLGNPSVTQNSCDQPEGYVANADDVDDTGGSSTLHAAFDEFSNDMTITLSNGSVTIESNGWPNHTSPYWPTTHDLYVAPTVANANAMSPGTIQNFVGTVSLTVSANPQKATSSTSTGLGAIGIAVSGSVLYNDEEGPNVPLDNAVNGLDYTGAHTGPQSYHYHLETKAWSDDDDKLIAIMADGFFLYGRKDPDGSYPSDLDASGGHFGPTPHNPDGEYHYHVQNELYLNQYYILFPGDFQGTPSQVIIN